MKGRFSADSSIIGLMLALLVVFSFVIALSAGTSVEPVEGSSYSPRPNGLLALYDWLPTLGYKSQRLENTPTFQIEANTGALFVVTPTQTSPFDHAEAQLLFDWVKQGHTLILLPGTSEYRDEHLLAMFHLKMSLKPEQAGLNLYPAQPVFHSPLVHQVVCTPEVTLHTAELGYLSLLTDGDSPVLSTVQIGNGQVYALSSLDLLANGSLAKADNALLVRNLLAKVPAGTTVAFDEYHHGFRLTEDLRSLTYQTPIGHAILYLLGICLLFILLTARRFGHPITKFTFGKNQRWSGDEYVVAMGTLLARGHKVAYVLNAVRMDWKSTMGRLYDIDSSLEDPVFAQRLAARVPTQVNLLEQVTSLLTDLSPLAPDFLSPKAILEVVKRADELAATLSKVGEEQFRI